MAVTYFTNELVLQLIEAYKRHECLWAPSSPNFKHKAKKNDAWENIARTVNVPRREVEAKMHTLRSQFIREKKKIERLRSSGNNDRYFPWFAYESLKFLLKEEKETSEGFDNLETQSHNNEEQYQESYTENFQIAPIPMLFQSTDSNLSNVNPTRKRANSYDDKSEDTLGGYTKQYRATPRENDEFDIFAQYVASELRETKDLHSVLMAKHYINDILFNARMGKYREEFIDVNSKTIGVKIEQDHDHDYVNSDE